ncbi:MAG: methyltransferase domain-containing protein [Chloroflexota bacterium]|nr:methyltransferase domain-containing protein [Chloroflexota bacterium]MDE2884341.1 methyltransferase domain-containing protein [Chloroflexota bacterium]
MTEQTSGTPDYTMGFSEEILEALRRGTAEANSAFLLPHLRPGLRVLDVGCGPGTISVGLAEAVEPGELHGVDMEESQVELARAVAASRRQENAVFHVGDVLALPFEDDFFDVAHCHNVLMHVPDTRAALTEVKRVLKPGGLIGCREMIGESSFAYPDFGVTRNAWDMFEDLLAADDGHPQLGKELKGHVLEAGFTNVRVSASWDIYSTPDDIAFIYGVVNNWFLSPEVTEAAIKYGAATRELCDRIADAYSRWKDSPGAVFGVAYGEIVAGKPWATERHAG